ncbi:MAG: 4-hydroxy-3-methylbut-2-enyl diphosphate reductase [Prevotella sp.]|nr:4-hydroxy-3-methylbut-2-enyl diphosphate reductase [Prevotella sp.]MDY5666439.1 4-hydroxy-3-methylbut-2-enyl diphosphate reductase [Alloprevotella sp.]
MMNIEIDAASGFCFGVTTAIRKAEEELAQAGSLCCLGDIVHNGSECERLHQAGLQTITHDDLLKLPPGTKVLLRAHGEPPATYATAANRGICIIDATCPVVLQLQRRIKKVYSENPRPQIVIYGKRGHAEVLGLVGQTNGEAVVIESSDEAAQLDFTRPIALFSQTTKPLEGFRQVVDYITQHMSQPSDFRYFDTICRQVANRLPNICSFAARHDVVVFVCGLKSSNGRVLHEACRKVNAHTYLVDTPEAINANWFTNAKSVGICGATSTPKWLMEKCAEKIKTTRWQN